MNTTYKATLSNKTYIWLHDKCDHEAAQRCLDIAEQLHLYLIDVERMKDYFPNMWEDVQSLPDEVLPTPFYTEVIDEWCNGWSLPSGVNSIIRAKDKEGQIKEFVYRSGHHAFNRIEQLAMQDNEILIITDDYLHHVNATDYH